jgi:ribosome maturation factor RimP
MLRKQPLLPLPRSHSRGYTGRPSQYPNPVPGGPGPAFFWVITEEMEDLQAKIEATLSAREPEVEVIALERPAGNALRLFIDHPSGVDLGMCERVTGHLRDLLQTYSLEVSSPGLDRPLTRPEHYRRFVGQRVKVRTSDAIEGRRNFTGTLTAASERSVSVDPGGGAVEIPLDRVSRSNLVPEPPEVPS